MLVLLAARPAPAPRPVLSAAVEPKVAQSGQPVSLQVRWLNPAAKWGKALRLNRRGLLGREVTIAVRTASGTLVALAQPADLGPPKQEDFQSLAPGESFVYDYPLTPASGKPLAPGAYEVRVTYRNSTRPPGEPAFLGTLQTRAGFRVRTPALR